MSSNSVSTFLPDDIDQALLIGRVWRNAGADAGPSIVAVRGGEVFDITRTVVTTADLFDRPDAVEIARHASGEALGPAHKLLVESISGDGPNDVGLIAPCDVQAIMACGVTFAVSLLERVIEEQAGGDPSKAKEVRETITALIGTDLSQIEPGSTAAMRLKAELERRGAWSQYMEVGIGPDAEVFSKSQPMSAVGFGAEIGLLPSSVWNNPEPDHQRQRQSRRSNPGQ